MPQLSAGQTSVGQLNPNPQWPFWVGSPQSPSTSPAAALPWMFGSRPAWRRSLCTITPRRGHFLPPVPPEDNPADNTPIVRTGRAQRPNGLLRTRFDAPLPQDTPVAWSFTHQARQSIALPKRGRRFDSTCPQAWMPPGSRPRARSPLSRRPHLFEPNWTQISAPTPPWAPTVLRARLRPALLRHARGRRTDPAIWRPSPRICEPTTVTIVAYYSQAGVSVYGSRATVSAYSSTAPVSAYSSAAGIARYSSSGTVTSYRSGATVVTYVSSAAVSRCSQGP